jgi:HAD superfamily hydrolase (TIGR01509 family)
MIRVLVSDFAVPPAAARAAPQATYRECRFGLGGAEGAEFHARLAAATGLTLGYEEFAEAWSDMFTEDPATVALLAAAPVERRYVLSNTNPIHWEFVRRRYPHVLAPFDELLASHELGLEKPDPAIYQWVIDHSGRPAEAHVFVDDIPENVAAARALGMRGILHTDTAALWRELAALGLADPAAPPLPAPVNSPTPPALALWG